MKGSTAQVLLIVFLGVGATDAYASEFVVTPDVFKKLSLAQKSLANNKPKEAVSRLLKLAKKRSLTDHERALAYQTLAYAYGNLNKFKEATGAFENCLQQNALPEKARHDTMYNLGQLYLATQKGKEGVQLLEAWRKETQEDSVDIRRMLVAGYVMLKKPNSAIPHARALIRMEKPAKERSYQALLGLYVQQEDWKNATDLLLTMLDRWPKEKYFLSLASVYLRRGDTKKSVATLQVATAGGFLSDPKQLREVAQRLIAAEVPAKAALFLDRNLKSGAITPSADMLKLAGRAWMLAHQRDRSVEVLTRAVKQNGGGDAVILLGHLYLQEEAWAKAVRVLKRGYDRTNDLEQKSEMAYLLGVATYSAGEEKKARTWFESAKAHPTIAKKVRSWMRHL